ncbi:unnamed protein product [Amoebophrya sp. A25]|nr:unnamed protein product [Amoebophrya sp. A25]|eukprot:GSA25T00024760001.1
MDKWVNNVLADFRQVKQKLVDKPLEDLKKTEENVKQKILDAIFVDEGGERANLNAPGDHHGGGRVSVHQGGGHLQGHSHASGQYGGGGKLSSGNSGGGASSASSGRGGGDPKFSGGSGNYVGSARHDGRNTSYGPNNGIVSLTSENGSTIRQLFSQDHQGGFYSGSNYLYTVESGGVARPLACELPDGARLFSTSGRASKVLSGGEVAVAQYKSGTASASSCVSEKSTSEKQDHDGLSATSSSAADSALFKALTATQREREAPLQREDESSSGSTIAWEVSGDAIGNQHHLDFLELTPDEFRGLEYERTPSSSSSSSKEPDSKVGEDQIQRLLANFSQDPKLGFLARSYAERFGVLKIRLKDGATTKGLSFRELVFDVSLFTQEQEELVSCRVCGGIVQSHATVPQQQKHLEIAILLPPNVNLFTTDVVIKVSDGVCKRWRAGFEEASVVGFCVVPLSEIWADYELSADWMTVTAPSGDAAGLDDVVAEHAAISPTFTTVAANGNSMISCSSATATSSSSSTYTPTKRDIDRSPLSPRSLATSKAPGLVSSSGASSVLSYKEDELLEWTKKLAAYSSPWREEKQAISGGQLRKRRGKGRAGSSSSKEGSFNSGNDAVDSILGSESDSEAVEKVEEFYNTGTSSLQYVDGDKAQINSSSSSSSSSSGSAGRKISTRIADFFRQLPQRLRAFWTELIIQVRFWFNVLRWAAIWLRYFVLVYLFLHPRRQLRRIYHFRRSVWWRKAVHIVRHACCRRDFFVEDKILRMLPPALLKIEDGRFPSKLVPVREGDLSKEARKKLRKHREELQAAEAELYLPDAVGSLDGAGISSGGGENGFNSGSGTSAASPSSPRGSPDGKAPLFQITLPKLLQNFGGQSTAAASPRTVPFVDGGKRPTGSSAYFPSSVMGGGYGATAAASPTPRTTTGPSSASASKAGKTSAGRPSGPASFFESIFGRKEKPVEAPVTTVIGHLVVDFTVSLRASPLQIAALGDILLPEGNDVLDGLPVLLQQPALLEMLKDEHPKGEDHLKTTTKKKPPLLEEVTPQSSKEGPMTFSPDDIRTDDDDLADARSNVSSSRFSGDLSQRSPTTLVSHSLGPAGISSKPGSRRESAVDTTLEALFKTLSGGGGDAGGDGERDTKPLEGATGQHVKPDGTPSSSTSASDAVAETEEHRSSSGEGQTIEDDALPPFFSTSPARALPDDSLTGNMLRPRASRKRSSLTSMISASRGDQEGHQEDPSTHAHGLQLDAHSKGALYRLHREISNTALDQYRAMPSSDDSNLPLGSVKENSSASDAEADDATRTSKKNKTETSAPRAIKSTIQERRMLERDPSGSGFSAGSADSSNANLNVEQHPFHTPSESSNSLSLRPSFARDHSSGGLSTGSARLHLPPVAASLRGLLRGGGLFGKRDYLHRLAGNIAHSRLVSSRMASRDGLSGSGDGPISLPSSSPYSSAPGGSGILSSVVTPGAVTNRASLISKSSLVSASSGGGLLVLSSPNSKNQVNGANLRPPRKGSTTTSVTAVTLEDFPSRHETRVRQNADLILQRSTRSLEDPTGFLGSSGMSASREEALNELARWYERHSAETMMINNHRHLVVHENHFYNNMRDGAGNLQHLQLKHGTSSISKSTSGVAVGNIMSTPRSGQLKLVPSDHGDLNSPERSLSFLASTPVGAECRPMKYADYEIGVVDDAPDASTTEDEEAKAAPVVPPVCRRGDELSFVVRTVVTGDLDKTVGAGMISTGSKSKLQEVEQVDRGSKNKTQLTSTGVQLEHHVVAGSATSEDHTDTDCTRKGNKAMTSSGGTSRVASSSFCSSLGSVSSSSTPQCDQHEQQTRVLLLRVFVPHAQQSDASAHLQRRKLRTYDLEGSAKRIIMGFERIGSVLGSWPSFPTTHGGNLTAAYLSMACPGYMFPPLLLAGCVYEAYNTGKRNRAGVYLHEQEFLLKQMQLTEAKSEAAERNAQGGAEHAGGPDPDSLVFKVREVFTKLHEFSKTVEGIASFLERFRYWMYFDDRLISLILFFGAGVATLVLSLVLLMGQMEYFTRLGVAVWFVQRTYLDDRPMPLLLFIPDREEQEHRRLYRKYGVNFLRVDACTGNMGRAIDACAANIGRAIDACTGNMGRGKEASTLVPEIWVEGKAGSWWRRGGLSTRDMFCTASMDYLLFCGLRGPFLGHLLTSFSNLERVKSSIFT